MKYGTHLERRLRLHLSYEGIGQRLVKLPASGADEAMEKEQRERESTHESAPHTRLAPSHTHSPSADTYLLQDLHSQLGRNRATRNELVERVGERHADPRTGRGPVKFARQSCGTVSYLRGAPVEFVVC